MQNQGIKIKYGNVAPGAKESFVPQSEDVADFVNLDELQQEGVPFQNIGNPGELYNTILDGSMTVFPDDLQGVNFGLWSKDVSGENGEFETPIVLSLISEGKFSSPGFTFTFDTDTNTFPTRLNIKWYSDGNLISQSDYEPTSAFFFCENNVEFFNQVEITFFALNMPLNRLRLRVIDYGYGTFFYGQNVLSMNIKQEIDPMSASISINTADFTLDLPGSNEYNFIERQPMSIYFNDNLLLTAFVEKSNRKARNIWDISCTDYIDILDGFTFHGGVYYEKNAIELIGEIFETANVPFQIDRISESETVSGHIGYTTCREALMQVCFAIGAVVDTTNSASVRVYVLDNSVSQTLPLERIMQGQNFDTKARVTGVTVTSHAYTATEDAEEIYKAETDGAGEEILVVFSEPKHDLSITNGQILQSGENFALINAQTGAVLTGKKYEHAQAIKTKKNTQILASDPQNVVEVNPAATLVSSRNVDKVLERCYNYYTKTKSIKMKVVDGVHKEEAETKFAKYGEKFYGSFMYGSSNSRTSAQSNYIFDTPTSVGDTVIAKTEFLGDLRGIIISQSFKITSGRTLVKDSVLTVEG